MPAQQQFYDIYEFSYQPFWQAPWFYWLLLGGCCLLIVWCCYRLYRWRRESGELELSAHEWALRQLASLSVADLNRQKDFKLLYVCLTSIIKQYFFKRYGWNVANVTDEELARFVGTAHLEDELARSITVLLQSMQLVKFANESSMRDVATADIKRATELIHRTKLVTD